jgi:hypothetical protein
MTPVGFESTTPVIEGAKTALDRVATVIAIIPDNLSKPTRVLDIWKDIAIQVGENSV